MKVIKLSRKHRKLIKKQLLKFREFFASDVEQFMIGVLFGMLVTMLASFLNC